MNSDSHSFWEELTIKKNETRQQIVSGLQSMQKLDIWTVWGDNFGKFLNKNMKHENLEWRVEKKFETQLHAKRETMNEDSDKRKNKNPRQ